MEPLVNKISETVEPDKNEKKEKRSYVLKLNGEAYTLSIEISSKDVILFELKKSNYISFKYYSKEYKYKVLLTILYLEKDNKYKDITKILELFDDLIKSSNILLYEDIMNNSISLEVIMNLKDKQEKCNIYLESKSLTERNMLDILIEEINAMKNKDNVNNKEDDVNYMEKELYRIDKEIIKMNQRKEEIKQKLKSIKGNQESNNKSIKEKERKNEIEIQIQINEEDIDKKIFLLNQEDKSCPKNEEINSEKIDLFVNNIRYGFKKTFYFYKTGLYTIRLIFKENMKSCKYLFGNCDKIKSISFFAFNTKEVTEMSGMFFNCKNITNLDLSCFDTKNVKDMNKLFYDCNNLKYLNVSSFNTNNVKNMELMFQGCYNIENLDLSSFNCQNVKAIRDIFCNCYSLKKIKINYNSLHLINYVNDEITEIVEI